MAGAELLHRRKQTNIKEKEMKIVKQAVLSTFISLGVFQAYADQTNVVQNLSIQLRGVQPGGPVTNRATVITGIAPAKIDTRDVIKALGLSTSNLFSKSARLVIVTPLSGDGSVVQVRDGTNRVDVSDYFQHSQVSERVSGSASNPASQRTVELDYSIQRLALRNAEGKPNLGLHFDVRGYASERTSAHVSRLELDAAGTGDLGGNPAVLRGEIEVQGDRLEVVPGGPVPTT
jgi:translation initiation factor 1 (eIF-1/SUI1)